MGTCDDDKSQSPSLTENENEEESEDDTIDPQVEQQEAWASSEGYSPLSDLDLNTNPYMMVSMGPTGNDSAGEDSDADYQQGAFYVNPSAFQSEQSEEGPAHDDPPSDFQAIAQSALGALDEEYNRTLRGERITPRLESDDNSSSFNQPGNSLVTAAGKKTNETKLLNDDDLHIIAAAFDEGKIEKSTHENTATFAVDWNSAQLSNLSHSDVKVDTDAVKKAVKEISLNSEAPFQQKFAAWQKCQKHDIIPQTPYKAFQRSTVKAIAATAALSRSATIAEALLRLHQENLLVTNTSKSIIIDVVGVDFVECESIETVQATFRPVVRWLGAWKAFDYEMIKLRLIGRDLSSTISSDPIDLLTPQIPSKFAKAQATCHSGIYHQWYAENSEVPSLIIAFNAGIWGYKEWADTIQFLSACVSELPMVITAYTLDEAQEDMEVIQHAVSGTSKVLWEAEENVFGSKVVRETKSSSNEYRENSGWQAWLL